MPVTENELPDSFDISAMLPMSAPRYFRPSRRGLSANTAPPRHTNHPTLPPPPPHPPPPPLPPPTHSAPAASTAHPALAAPTPESVARILLLVDGMAAFRTAHEFTDRGRLFE